MNGFSRSRILKAAAVISLLLCVVNILVSLPFIAQGAATLNQGPDMPPFFVEMTLFVTGVVGAVAAYGTWKQMRWGILLTIFVNLVNVLSAAPGILFAPRPWGLVASAITILLSVSVIVLCLWHKRETAAA